MLCVFIELKCVCSYDPQVKIDGKNHDAAEGALLDNIDSLKDKIIKFLVVVTDPIYYWRNQKDLFRNSLADLLHQSNRDSFYNSDISCFIGAPSVDLELLA